MDREELVKKAIMTGVKYETLTLNIVKYGLNVDEMTAKNVLDYMISKDIIVDFDYEGDDLNMLCLFTINNLMKDKENRQNIFNDLCKMYDDIQVENGLIRNSNFQPITLTEQLKNEIICWVKLNERIGLGTIEKKFNVDMFGAIEIMNYLIKEKMVVKNNLDYDVVKENNKSK